MKPQVVDVVVLGSGIAGLASAVAAQAHGLKTLVLEKAAEVGGGTCFSTALIWIGCNHLARAQGVEDRPEAVLEYMKFLGGGQEDPHNMRALVDHSPGALRYFEKRGIAFRVVGGMADHYFGVAPGALRHGRVLEAGLISGKVLGRWKDRVVRPKNQPYCVTAEELVASRAGKWDPQLLDSRRREDMRGLGVGLVTNFLRAALAEGVEVRTRARSEELLADKGRVSGVRLAGGQVIRARKGVVIAVGGYESNPELVQRFEGVPGWQSYFPSSLQGDGLLLGGRVGGAVGMIQNQLQLFLGFHVPVGPKGEREFRLAAIIELCSPHTMVVNSRGRRFADESVFQRIAARLREFDVDRHAHANLPCFLVFDRQFTQTYSFGGGPVGEIPEFVHQAGSLAELARALGIDAAGLEETARRFNGFVDAGVDGDFGRKGDLRFPGRPTLGRIERPPFYGVKLTPSGSGSAGLLTNRRAQVLDNARKPIPGLYAVGNAAAKTELGTGYQAGLTMASGMTFGLLAAKHLRS